MLNRMFLRLGALVGAAGSALDDWRNDGSLVGLELARG